MKRGVNEGRCRGKCATRGGKLRGKIQFPSCTSSREVMEKLTERRDSHHAEILNCPDPFLPSACQPSSLCRIVRLVSKPEQADMRIRPQNIHTLLRSATFPPTTPTPLSISFSFPQSPPSQGQRLAVSIVTTFPARLTISADPPPPCSPKTDS